MQVTKRDGSMEDVKFDKIAARIKKQVYGLSNMVNYSEVAQKVIQGIYDGVSTRELDQLASQKAASLVSTHPDYSKLAARIAITSLHKETKKLFSQVIKELYEYVDPKTGEPAPLISKEVYSIVKKNSARLNGAIIHDRDFLLDYFGFRTMERAYLLKTFGKPTERPQHLFMRVAVGIHMEDIDKAIETYDLLSQKYFTHATPTLFNAGTPKPQMSSCFLLTMKEDSISGIYDTLKQCALISQSAGGIGLSIHNIRATGSYIKGTNGVSNGIVPMLRNFNDTARYVDQCFEGNANIQTEKGMVEISKIKTGDKVLDSSGTYGEVKKLKEFEYKGEMIVVTVQNEKISVTPKHPFLVIKNCPDIPHDEISKLLEIGTLNLEWIDAADLTEKDVIAKY